MSKLETRINIIRSSKKLFAAKGFEGVRTKEIAEASGISEVTLYKYFNSKEELYAAVDKEESKALDPEKVFSEVKHEDVLDDLKSIANHIINHLYSNKEIILMKQKEGKTSNIKRAKLKDDPIYIRTATLLGEYKDKGVLKANPEEVARAFVGNMRGLCRMAIDENVSKDVVKKEVNSFIEIIGYGIITG